MFNRIKKIVNYICHYNTNKKALRILDDKIALPHYLRHYTLSEKYTYHHLQTAEQILSYLLISAHSIEKGLAMTDMRLGFGQPKIQNLVEVCVKYLERFTDFPSRLQNVMSIIFEYEDLHKKNDFALMPETKHAIDLLHSKVKCSLQPTHTQMVSRESYFENAKGDYYQLAHSRHSVRDFTGEEVDADLLSKAFDLAQKAPSACNRQSTRVYAVYNPSLREQLVDIQNHQRGFADNANPLLVVTTELQSWGYGEEWFGGYLDGGIYIANLLYALHYYHIAAIPLNWYADEENNDKIHKLLNIPESQVVVAFVACGIPTDSFKLVTSTRCDVGDIVKIIR